MCSVTHVHEQCCDGFIPTFYCKNQCSVPNCVVCVRITWHCKHQGRNGLMTLLNHTVERCMSHHTPLTLTLQRALISCSGTGTYPFLAVRMRGVFPSNVWTSTLNFESITSVIGVCPWSEWKFSVLHPFFVDVTSHINEQCRQEKRSCCTEIGVENNASLHPGVEWRHVTIILNVEVEWTVMSSREWDFCRFHRSPDRQRRTVGFRTSDRWGRENRGGCWTFPDTVRHDKSLDSSLPLNVSCRVTGHTTCVVSLDSVPCRALSGCFPLWLYLSHWILTITSSTSPLFWSPTLLLFWIQLLTIFWLGVYFFGGLWDEGDMFSGPNLWTRTSDFRNVPTWFLPVHIIGVRVLVRAKLPHVRITVGVVTNKILINFHVARWGYFWWFKST